MIVYQAFGPITGEIKLIKPIKCACYRQTRAFTSTVAVTSNICAILKSVRGGGGYKIYKPLSSLLVCGLIMPLAETWSSKFHISPRSFASRPNIHFSDIFLSAAGIISRHTSRLNGFIY